ncbi:hypothetical protein Ancab_016622 [Ancistrocladus abbreviatus]
MYLQLGDRYCFSSHVESSVQKGSKLPAHSNNSNNEENTGVDWKDLGFDLKPTDYMYVMKCSEDDGFTNGQLSRYGNIVLSPSAGVLNYGQLISVCASNCPTPLLEANNLSLSLMNISNQCTYKSEL